jgi:membrane protease subunit HflC
MQAYEAALTSESTYMVLSPDSEFFDFFSAIGRNSGE